MAGHSRPKDGVLSHAYVTASRMHPTCGSFYAEVGQARLPVPSTSLCLAAHEVVDARHKAGHDGRKSVHYSSWPGIAVRKRRAFARLPSTSLRLPANEVVDARHKAGHDGSAMT